MLTIYGIKNCDTMQKAFKWLDAKGLKYQFHNYKEQGIDKATIEKWLQHLPLEKLVNSKGTTFRTLTEKEKTDSKISAKAIVLMIKNPSLIKRPVFDFGKNKFLLGFDEKALQQMI
jgi:arsenate reductase (glutaredoxin)